MAKQIIFTQNNFGIPIELQFVSNTNSPIDLTDKIVEVAISYDGTIIDVLQATIKSYTNGTAYIIVNTKHTSNVGLYTTFWSVKDKYGYITAQEDLYYYVKGEYNGAETPDIEQDKGTIEEEFDKVNSFIENLEIANSNIEETLSKRIKTVKDYGAKGDGVTDDTEAIQNCIDNENGAIFPSGEYLIKTNLQINGKLYGFGNAKIIISKDFTKKSNSVPDTEIAIYNKSFSTSFNNPDTLDIKGITFIKKDGDNVPYTIIGLANTVNSAIRNCNIQHDETYSTCGLDLYSCNKNLVVANNNINLKSNAKYGGVWCRQIGVNDVSENIKIIGNNIVNGQGDEVIAMYGYRGGLKNITIKDNILTHIGSANNVVTLGANDTTVEGGNSNAYIENVIFSNNIINANNCKSKVFQVSMEAKNLKLDNILIDNNIINLASGIEDVTRIIDIYDGTNIVISNNNINQNANESVIGINANVTVTVKGNNFKGYYKNVTRGKVLALENNIIVRHKESIFFEPLLVKDNYIEPLSYFFCICENNTEDIPLRFINNVVKTKFGHNITKISQDGNNLCSGNTIEYMDNSNTGYLLYVGKWNNKNTVVKDNLIYNSDKLLSTEGAITNVNNTTITQSQ